MGEVEPMTRAECDGALGHGRNRAGGAGRRLSAVIAAAAALTVAAPAEAQSQPPVDQARMAADMHTYFAGEKGQAPVFFGAGLVGMGVGAGMIFAGGDLVRGAGFPVAGVGLVQALVGTVLLLRTNKQVAALDAQLAKDPAGFKRDESKRVAGVNTSFYALMVLESALIIGGSATAVVASQKDCCKTLQGVGLGFAAQGAVTLMLDLFALARAREYADSLRRFEPASGAARLPGGPAPMSAGPSFGPISIGGRF